MATLTAYPVAGANSPCDGHIRNVNGATWAAARDAAAGTAADVIDTTGYLGEASTATNYTVTRGFFFFDTSALGAGATINSATLSLAGTGDANLDANSTTIEIVEATPAATNTLSTDDFDQVGTTSFSSKNVSAYTTTDGTYNDFVLNASGLAAINKTGITKFAGRLGRDFNNSAPTGANRVLYRTADNADVTKDPKLVIDYTEGSTVSNQPTLLTLNVG